MNSTNADGMVGMAFVIVALIFIVLGVHAVVAATQKVDEVPIRKEYRTEYVCNGAHGTYTTPSWEGCDPGKFWDH
jgi:tetrahydromethanopterin S-methyltransferase subunit D